MSQQDTKAAVINQTAISEDELVKIIQHYYKCFGLQFNKWLKSAYPEIELNDILEKYENDDDEYQQIYMVEDIKDDKKQNVKIVIQFSDIKPEPITQQTIENNVFSNETKEAIMTFFSNSYMSIKYILKYIEEHTKKNIYDTLLENAMYIYKKDTNYYLSYYITFDEN